MVLCPNEHDNLAGLSHCKVCGLPLLDLPVLFESLADSLASRAGMGRPSPRTVLVGLGTAGAGLIDVARAAHVEPLPDHTYLAIDAKGAASEIGSADVLRLALGGSTPSAGTFCGVGQALVKDDPCLMPVLRKAGLSRQDSGQVAFLVAAIGGGIGSAASVIVQKARQLNSECYTVALVIIPGTNESFHNKLNSYYGLSCLLGAADGYAAADLVVAVHYDRMKKIRGVGPSAEELRTEGLLAAFSDLLMENLSQQSISEVVRINRSMGITLVVPCLALGRSLEIFGNLGNILESAISFPANNVAKQAVLVCHLLLRVPESRAGGFSEEMVSEQLGSLIRRHLPRVRGTSLSITYSAEQHDRVDACLLLGGDLARAALFANGDGVSFEQELTGEVSWETYGLTEEDMRRADSTLDGYDRALERAGGARRREGLGKNGPAAPTKDNAIGPVESAEIPGGGPSHSDRPGAETSREKESSSSGPTESQPPQKPRGQDSGRSRVGKKRK